MILDVCVSTNHALRSYYPKERCSMRPSFLFFLGLIFLGTALLGLGFLSFRILGLQAHDLSTSNIAEDVLRLPTATPIPVATRTPAAIETYLPTPSATGRPTATRAHITTPTAAGTPTTTHLPPTETPLIVQATTTSTLTENPATVRAALTQAAAAILTLAPTSTSLDVLPSHTPIIIPTSRLIVETEWPMKMEVNRSGTIRVSLIRVGDNTYLPTVEIAGHTAIVSTLIIPTPNPGPETTEYQAFVTSYIPSTTTLEVVPPPFPEQLLDQSRIDWIWNIVANKPGDHEITVYIYVHWKPKTDAGSPTAPLLVWHSTRVIKAVQPLITIGQISVATLISGSVGSGLSVPWLYSVFKEKRKTTRKRKKGDPVIS